MYPAKIIKYESSADCLVQESGCDMFSSCIESYFAMRSITINLAPGQCSRGIGLKPKVQCTSVVVVGQGTHLIYVCESFPIWARYLRKVARKIKHLHKER